MRRNGLEWLHRVLHGPRRLAKRYLVGEQYLQHGMVQDFAVRESSAPRRLKRISRAFAIASGWGELGMAVYLVTGGWGFIGSLAKL